MSFSIKYICILGFISLVLSACVKTNTTPVPTTELVTIDPVIQTEAILTTQTSQLEPNSIFTSTPNSNDYADCGTGGLIDVGYYFRDHTGKTSPTQLIRFQKTTDEVRDYMAVITCLKNDEGVISNPDEVENGYENEILFFDKNGKAHAYRIIIGGHYVAPYDPTHKDITGSVNGGVNQFFNVQEWIDVTQNQFVSTNNRQIGVDIYLNDSQGNLSKVLTQVYRFRETNLQIAEALKAGEGYPNRVPDGFFLFAMDSWLVQEE